jgi:hypothetical protein
LHWNYQELPTDQQGPGHSDLQKNIYIYQWLISKDGMLRRCGGASFSARRQDLPLAAVKKLTVQATVQMTRQMTMIASRQDGLY